MIEIGKKWERLRGSNKLAKKVFYNGMLIARIVDISDHSAHFIYPDMFSIDHWNARRWDRYCTTATSYHDALEKVIDCFCR